MGFGYVIRAGEDCEAANAHQSDHEAAWWGAAANSSISKVVKTSALATIDSDLTKAVVEMSNCTFLAGA